VSIVLLGGARAGWDRLRGGMGDARAGGRVEQPAPAPSVADWLAEGFARTVDGFVLAGRNTLPVSLACAIAGIIVGVVGLTGLGLKFSALMLSFSQGNLLLALLLLLLASLVLGMGLPVTASYIVLIILAGPALVNDFGLPVLVAHMVVFWFSQDSNVTPPVCLAAYAAAGVAGSDPMKTGLHAWKYAKGLYLIPLLMVVHPALVLGGPLIVVLGWAALAMVSLAAFAAALEGYALGPLTTGGRVLLFVAAAAVFHPSPVVGGVGGAAALVYVFWHGSTTGRVQRA
jgi:TRAP-type uncharacterized transport system fused permease subunit